MQRLVHGMRSLPTARWSNLTSIRIHHILPRPGPSPPTPKPRARRTHPPQSTSSVTPLSYLFRPPRRTFSQTPWPEPAKPPIASAPNPRTSRDGYKHFPGGSSRNPFTHPTPNTRYLLLLSSTGIGVYLYANLDYAPFTGRRRILGISRAQEMAMGDQAFRMLLHEFDGRLLHPSVPPSRRVRKVVARIAATAQRIDPALTDGFDWKIAVVDVDEPNALCVPGGRMIITTGLLRILPTDDDLAIVLAHEIAHALNRHGAESMHLQRILVPVLIVANHVLDMRWFPSLLLNFFVSLPYGRKLEYEADEVGLTLCAEACYDPRVAPSVFRRLAEMQNEQSGSFLADKIQPFLSTHPQSKERAKRLMLQLPEKVDRYNSRCIRHSPYRNSWG